MSATQWGITDIHCISRADWGTSQTSASPGLKEKYNTNHKHVLFVASRAKECCISLSPSHNFYKADCTVTLKFSHGRQPQWINQEAKNGPRIEAGVNWATLLTSTGIGSLTERLIQNTSALAITIHDLSPLISKQTWLLARASINLLFPHLEILRGALGILVHTQTCDFLLIHVNMSAMNLTKDSDDPPSKNADWMPLEIQTSQLNCDKRVLWWNDGVKFHLKFYRKTFWLFYLGIAHTNRSLMNSGYNECWFSAAWHLRDSGCSAGQ